MRQQVKAIIASPQVFQYLIEHTITVMIQNNIAINKEASGDFIRGVNRGSLILLNSIVEHIDDIQIEEMT